MRAAVFSAAIAAAAAAPSVIEQVHIAYTPKAGVLAVDFVDTGAGAGPFFAYTSMSNSSGAAWSRRAATSIVAPTIGALCQAVLDFSGAQPGASAYYKVGSASANSSVFEVVPVVARPEVFAVFGDFGIANDVCMDDLIASAASGDFDSVLHVGAYNFEDQVSTVGNGFMRDIQGYAATHPVMPAAGNHERCTKCPGIDGLADSTHNFTEYKARFHSVSLTSNTGNNIFYSFNKGLTHFVVFSAEAYLYSRDAAFLANQLAFMSSDLAAVDRSVTPWVVALVHKDYTMEPEAYAAFSPVLIKGKVDILFCGHVHYYNRYMPLDVLTGDIDHAAVSADGATYSSPKYMTIIVSGASGDREDDSKYVKEAASYTGSQNYGYGLYTAKDAHTATWTWKTVKADGPGAKDFSDKLTITKQ